MSTKALRKELLAAIAMVIVAAIALSGSTYAWFASNSTVTATGMNVRTETSDNLFIAADELTSTAVKDDEFFKTTALSTVNALLEPVSTTDGKTFFYNSMKNVSATGAALTAKYTEYGTSSASKAAFSTNYETSNAEGYVDYVFQLKAINTKTEDKYVDIDLLNLTYATTGAVQKAFRAAVFIEQLFDGTTNPTGAVGSLFSILSASDSAYFTAGKAVKTTETVDDVTSLNQTLRIGTVPAGKTYYFKVVVRLWLEGEDETCNNTTFAELTDKWALDIRARLETENHGVRYLNQLSSTGNIDLKTASASSTVTAVVDGNTYYGIDGKSLDGNQLYTTATGALTSASKIYTVVEGNLFDVTNQCTLPAPVTP